MSSEIRPDPSQRFAQFVGEIVGFVGNATGSLEKYIVGKIHEATLDTSLAKVVAKVEENGDKIAKALFTIGCFYNFYTFPSAYMGGTVVGALASAAPFPFPIDSLRQGELLGNTSEDGYAAPKVMFLLAAVNYYLGTTLLDDTVLSIFAGLITGNYLFHRAKTSTAGQMITWLGNQAAAYTEIAMRKLPFTNVL